MKNILREFQSQSSSLMMLIKRYFHLGIAKIRKNEKLEEIFFIVFQMNCRRLGFERILVS